MDLNTDKLIEWNRILQMLGDAVLASCRDGPSGVHLRFNLSQSLTGSCIEMFVCGWMGLKQDEDRILICQGSNYLLRTALSKLPIGRKVAQCQSSPASLAFQMTFDNGDELGIKAWKEGSTEYANSLYLWEGAPYDSTVVSSLYVGESEVTHGSDVGVTYCNHKMVSRHGVQHEARSEG